MLYSARFAAVVLFTLVATLATAQAKFAVKETYKGALTCDGMCSEEQLAGTVTLTVEVPLQSFSFDHLDGNTIFKLSTGDLQFQTSLSTGDWNPGDTSFRALIQTLPSNGNRAITLCTAAVSWAKQVLKVKAKFNTLDMFSPAYAGDLLEAANGKHAVQLDVSLAFEPNDGPAWAYSLTHVPGQAKVKKTTKVKNQQTIETRKISIKRGK